MKEYTSKAVFEFNKLEALIKNTENFLSEHPDVKPSLIKSLEEALEVYHNSNLKSIVCCTSTSIH
jgi:hypothetical protein